MIQPESGTVSKIEVSYDEPIEFKSNSVDPLADINHLLLDSHLSPVKVRRSPYSAVHSMSKLPFFGQKRRSSRNLSLFPVDCFQPWCMNMLPKHLSESLNHHSVRPRHIFVNMDTGRHLPLTIGLASASYLIFRSSNIFEFLLYQRLARSSGFRDLDILPIIAGGIWGENA